MCSASVLGGSAALSRNREKPEEYGVRRDGAGPRVGPGGRDLGLPQGLSRKCSKQSLT